jgi:2-(1,2-epoxy-1,2-dihydrophenyl)acetyl-CoA isomerase
LTAEAAFEAGLVDFLVDDEQVFQEAHAVARKLASGPTAAYGEIKRLFIQSGGAGVASQMEAEAVAIARTCRTSDAKEGLNAFIEKRKPLFKGR